MNRSKITLLCSLFVIAVSMIGCGNGQDSKKAEAETTLDLAKKTVHKAGEELNQLKEEAEKSVAHIEENAKKKREEMQVQHETEMVQHKVEMKAMLEEHAEKMKSLKQKTADNLSAHQNETNEILRRTSERLAAVPDRIKANRKACIAGACKILAEAGKDCSVPPYNVVLSACKGQ